MCKKDSQVSSVFLQPTFVNAARKMLMILTPVLLREKSFSQLEQISLSYAKAVKSIDKT
jgi:hypothetical protein